MNRTYKLVFNRSLNVWQAVSELATAHGKSSSGKSATVKSLRGKSRGLLKVAALALMMGGTLGAAPQMAQAQSVWSAPGSGAWDTAGNWTGGVPVAGGTATIGSGGDGLGGATINIGTGSTVGTLRVQGGPTAGSPDTLTLSSGTLTFNNNGAGAMLLLDSLASRNLTISSAITSADAGGLTISNSSAYGGTLTISGAIGAGGNALTLNAGLGATETITGAITNISTLNKSGDGTVNLNAANVFNAGSTVNFSAGTLGLGNANALGSGANLPTINLGGGTGQSFDIASGNRTLANQFVLGRGFAVFGGSGNTLTLSATQNATVDPAGVTFSVGPTSTAGLALGANFALQGTGAVNKAGFGTLTLSSVNSTFSGGLNIQAGAVATGTFANTLVLAGSSGTNHMLGTGNISLTDSSSVLRINGTNAATVQIGDTAASGGTITLANGSALLVNNGSAVSFVGGTIDFGAGANKGSLQFSGPVTLGSTTFANAANASMALGQNTTFLTGSTIAASGVNFNFNPAQGTTTATTQSIAYDPTIATGGNVNITGNVAFNGGVNAISNFTNINNFTVGGSTTVNSGTVNLGNTATNLNGGLTLGGGTLNLGRANQFGATPPLLTLANGTASTFNLNSYSQGTATVAGIGGLSGTGSVQFNLDTGFNTASNTTLNLGAYSTAPAFVRVSGWDGNLGAAGTDHIYATGLTAGTTLANMWFQGFGQGATVSATGELMPTSNLSSEWNNGAGTANTLWFTPTNWVGADAYNIPNHSGATAYFGDLAGSLASITVGLAGNTVTVGNILFDNSSMTGVQTLYINNGTIILDSGDPATPATVIKGTAGTAGGIIAFNSNVTLVVKSDTIFRSMTDLGRMTITGPVTGSGDITFLSDLGNNFYWQLYATTNSSGATPYSGDVYAQGGIYNYLQSGSFGKTWYVSGGAFYNNVNTNSGLTVKNNFDSALVLLGNYQTDGLAYTYAGNSPLDAVRTITVIRGTQVAGERASTTYTKDFNFVDASSTTPGGLNFAGAGTKEILSGNNTFSGGLTVSGGTLFTTVQNGTTLRLGDGIISAGNDYLGIGNITVSNNNSVLSVESQGNAGGLYGGALTVGQGGNANSQFRYLGGGDFTLAGGTLTSGTAANTGTFVFSGDLTFAGTTLKNTPRIQSDPSTNPTQTNTIYDGTGTGVLGAGNVNTNVDGQFNFIKTGSGVTILDSSITSFQPRWINLFGGALQTTRDNQITNANATLVFNGGTLDLNNTRQNYAGILNLLGNSSLQLGSTGTLVLSGTTNYGGLAATGWSPTAVWSIQNNNGVWLSDGSGTYVRWGNAGGPQFSAAQLANIAFTGYEAGAQISVVGGLYYYLLPSATAVATNEWSGGADPINSWGTAGNWLSGSVPDAPGASVSIRDTDGNLDGKTINVSSNTTVGRLNLQSGANQQYTIGGAGTLIFDDGGAGNSAINSSGASNPVLATKLQLNNSVALNTDMAVANGWLTLAGAVSGTGGFVKNGIGTLMLGTGQASDTIGSSTYSGGFAWNTPSVIQFNANGALFGNGVWTIGNGVAGQTFIVETTNDNVAGPNNGSHTISTDYVLQGNLTLRKDTVNGVTITDQVVTPAVNSYNTLSLAGNGTLVGMNTVNVFASAAMFDGTIGFAAVVADRFRLSFDGTLTGTGGIIKTGSGTLAFNGVGNDFSGGVTLNGGSSIIELGNDNALGTGALSFTTGTNLGLVSTGTLAAPLTLPNQIMVSNTAASVYLGVQGSVNFNYAGTSVLNNTGIFDIFNQASGQIMVFGADHVLSGTAKVQIATPSNQQSSGIIRMLGANTYTGGTLIQSPNFGVNGLVELGRDTESDVTGAVTSGPLGTGTVSFNGGIIAGWSTPGSTETQRFLGNNIFFQDRAFAFGDYGAVRSLVFTTPTIALRNGSSDLTIQGTNNNNNAASNPAQANPYLTIQSQLVNNAAGDAGGITKVSVGVLELTNPNNMITGGIVVSGGAVQATATGDVTTGVLDAGHNYLGSGKLTVNSGGTISIATSNGSTVRLSGSGIDMNGTGNVNVGLNTGNVAAGPNMAAGVGTNIVTMFDTTESFMPTPVTGTASTGAITTTGMLQMNGALSDVATVGARLVTPNLQLTSGTLNLANANLVAGVKQVTMDGGTLATAGVSQTFATTTQLTMTINGGTLDFGTGATLLNPAIVTVGSLDLTGLYLGNASATLNITNWTGAPGSGSGADQFVVTNGLTAGQKIMNIWIDGYGVGVMAYVNAQGKMELLPFGSAFTWGNGNGTSTWAPAGNWSGAEVGSPSGAGATATFADLDPNLNGETITVATNTTVGNIAFSSTAGQAFTIAGTGQLTLNSNDTTIPSQISLNGNSRPTINNQIMLDSDLVISGIGTGTLTLNGSVGGGGKSVSMGGTGALVLNSAGNAFTGGLNLNAGTTVFGASSTALDNGPAGVGMLTINGGTVQAANGAQVLWNPVTINGDFTVAGANGLTFAGRSASDTATIANGATITVADAAGSLTFGNNLPLTGAGNLTKDGAGTLNLNSASPTYSGDVTAEAGAIGIGDNTGFGTGKITLEAGTTLVANATVSVGNNVALAGNATVATGANNMALNGVISDAGKLTKTGTGNLALGGNNTYAGGTDVNAGVVTLTNAAGAGAGAINVANSATLETTFSSGALNNNVALNGAASAFRISGSNESIAGNITGVADSAVNVNQTGTTFSGDNSGFAGTFSVESGGSATVTNDNNLGAATAKVLVDGDLNVGNSATPATAPLTFAQQLGGTGTVNVALSSTADTFGFGSTAAGGGYTGTLAMNTGTFTLDTNSAAVLTNAALQLNSGAFMPVTANATIGSLTLNGGTVDMIINPATGQPNGMLTTTGVFNVPTASKIELDMTGLGAAGLLLADDGISNQIIKTNAAVSAADLANLSLIDSGGALITATSMQAIMQGGNVVANVRISPATLSANDSGVNGVYVSYALSRVDLVSGQTLTLDNTGAAAGNASELKAQVVGGGNLSLMGAANPLKISNGANTYSGATTIAGGTVQAGVENAFGTNSSSMTVNNGATLDINGFATQVNNLTGAGEVTNAGAAATLTANNTTATAFSGLLSGAMGLTKAGAGTLTLTGANAYSGGTTISGGVLTLTGAKGAGDGGIAINTGAGSTTTGLNLDFVGDFANVLSGAGTATVAAAPSSVTITGNNAGYTGNWNILGTAAVNSTTTSSTANLGTGTVNIAAAATLNASSAGAYAYNNATNLLGTLNANSAGAYSINGALTGNGVVNASNGGGAFSFGPGVGSAYTGKVALSNSTFALSGDNTTALTKATLVVGMGNITTVSSGDPTHINTQTIGGLSIDGGTLSFHDDVLSDPDTPGIVITGALDISHAGTIRVIIPDDFVNNLPDEPTHSLPLLEQDNGSPISRLVQAEGGVIWAGGNLTLVDQNGDLVTNGKVIGIEQRGVEVARGTYDFGLTMTSDGINVDGFYVNYGLRQVELLEAQTLTLTPADGATGLAADLRATIIGAGNLEIDAGTGNTVSLSNSDNGYTGLTLASNGTLRLDASNVLGYTSGLKVASGGAVDMNGFSQSVGALDTVAGGRVNITTGSTLTITDAQRTAGNTLGGGIDSDTLSGAGAIVIDPSIVYVNGDQPGYTGLVTVSGGSQLVLNSASAYDQAAGITLETASDTLTFGNARAYDPAWTAIPHGTAAVAISGPGSVRVNDGSDVTFAGDNSGFTGVFSIDTLSQMTALEQKNLGAATIDNAGIFTADTATDWTLANAMTGAGSFIKDGAGNLSIGQANAMTGATTISGGVLTLTDAGGVGSGGIAISTMAGDAAAGLNLAFTTASDFSNTLTGMGVTTVAAGSQTATITGANSGYTGLWRIAGTAAIDPASTISTTKLGSGTVNIAAGGLLAANTTGAFSFDNALTGAGTLAASNNGNAFSFGSGAGNAFAGTLTLTGNTFLLDGDNTTALTNAMLKVGAGNVTTVGDGNQSIGGLTFNGGTMIFDATAPAQATATSFISAQTLDVSGTGVVQINVSNLYDLPTPTLAGDLSLFEQSQVNDGLQVVAATGAVIGTGAGLTLQDQTGTAITAAQNIAVNQNGNHVANGTYDYGLGVGASGDGLYVGYKLAELELLTSGANALTLIEDAGATGLDADLAAKLTGTGDLIIAATDTVSLSNPGNTFTGTTTIESGTLQAGAADVIATSSAVEVKQNTFFDVNGFDQSVSNLTGKGEVTNSTATNATLTLNNTAPATNTFDGTITGANLAVDVANGTTILTGANTYQGGTTVEGGATLQLGDGGATGGIVGNVVNNGTLAFDRTDDALDMTGVISGTGGVNQNGTGTTILSGVNSYQGATAVNAGTLVVEGSIALSSLTTVSGGALLTGTGTVGNTMIATGGAFQPGNGVAGSFSTVGGNLEFQPGAWYVVDVDPDTSSFATVTGTAALGGATVSATYAPGAYVRKRYTILTATGGINGTFDDLIDTDLPAGFHADLSYDLNNAYLDLALNFSVPGGLNINQQNAADALTGYFDRTGSIPEIFGALTPDDLTQVSGELATAAQQTNFDAMNQFMGAMADASGVGRDLAACNDAAGKNPSQGSGRADCNEPRRNVWATVYGGGRNTDGNAALGSHSATGRVYGAVAGADYLTSAGTVAGLALAGGLTNFDLAGGLGSGRSGLFQAGVYGRHHMGPAYLSGMLAYGWQDITTRRNVTVDGLDRLQADFDTNAFSGRLEGGWGFTAAWGNLTPYAAAQFTSADLPGYSERATTGNDTFALRYHGETATAWRSELGLRAGKALRLADGSLSLSGRLAWAHDFNTDRDMTATFQSLPGATFTVNGAAPSNDAALVTIAAEMNWGNGWSAGLAFDGEFSDASRSYASSAALRYRW